MSLTSSYIFLEREQRKSKSSNSGLTFSKSFPEKIKELLTDAGYNISSRSKNSSCTGGTICIATDANTKIIQLQYQQTRAGYLLDISVESKNQQNIQILAKLDGIVQDSNSELNKQYLIILSYDAVSEYYCNRLYPLLNSFERKLKQLFFNIYIANFGQLYFNKTVDEEAAKRIKGNVSKKSGVKKNKDELYIKQWFYGFSYQDMYDTLFHRNVTDSDRESVERFLDDNSDLSRIDDVTLREQFKKCLGRNNWERLNFNNRLRGDFESLLRQIQSLRNDVMHGYFINEDQYSKFVKLLAKAIRSVDGAIKVTQKEDFGTQVLVLQEELARNIIAQMEPIRKAMHELARMPSFKSTQEAFKQIPLESSKLLQPISEQIRKTMALASMTIKHDNGEEMTHETK